MTAIMKGVRVLEVSEHGFVPMAGALLADWGADVIKIEPAERGDAARGLVSATANGIQVLLHHANRGKQSLGLDLSKPEGREILYKLVKDADIFLTNKLPSVRKKLKVDVEDIRAHNPNIIYVRGSGQGARGPEADRGSYDLIGYWHRSGTSLSVTSPGNKPPFLPAPGFGDFTGSMHIAGGMMGALYHRQRTGEALVVDVSLLSTGMWAMAGALSCADNDPNWAWPPRQANPMSAIYETKDGRWIVLTCLQSGYYWPILWDLIGRPDIAKDPRFAEQKDILANCEAGEQLLTKAFAERTFEEWVALLQNFSGQWGTVQDYRQVLEDPQLAPNGYMQTVRTAKDEAFQLVAAPVQFGEEPAVPTRAPDFNEHGDAILAGLGFDWDSIVDLKVKGVVA